MNDVIDNDSGEVLDMRSLTHQEVSPMVAAEINQMVATAKKFPRRQDSAIADEIYARATLNEGIAGECNYALKRDSKVLNGPSIRFAEIIRASYGNIRVASRFVRIDADDPTRAAVIVEAVAFDMQSNNSEIIQERRSIMTSGKGGGTPRMYGADMTNTTIKAAFAIARRNAILAVVPKALWIDAYVGAVKVIKGDARTLTQRRANAFAAMAEHGIEAPDLLAALGCRMIDDVTIEHLPTLRGMLTAILEGEAPASVMGRFATDAPAHVKVNNPLKDEPVTGPSTANQAAKTDIGDKSAPNPMETQGSGSEPDAKQDNANPGADAKKPDPISSGPEPAAGGAATGASDDAGGTKAGGEKKTAQAASGTSPTRSYEDAEGYIEYMQDSFDRATSKTAIKEVWSGTRDDRRELLGADQLAALEKDKKAAEAKLDAANA